MASDSVGVDVRAQAARVVDSVVRDGRSLDAALAAAEGRLPTSEHALLRMLCFGTLRFHWRLSAIVAACLKKPLKRRDRIIHALLTVGVFQLHETRIAQHAAVSLTVESARLLGRPGLKGLVNGVLRNVQRKPELQQEATGDEATFNHPSWFIRRVRDDWPDRWRSVLDANNERAPMWLRVNARRSEQTTYRERLAESLELPPDDATAILPGVPQGIRLRTPMPVDALPGFAAGEISVQDAAAQLAAPWLLAEGGRRILDACAAPGGKTAHLLELADSEATLTAIDVDPDRAAQIEANLARLGLMATVLAADASNPSSWWDGSPFDRVLLDAPCSASGVVRRHPDVKHLRRESDIQRLAATQGALLDACWATLAPGGTLLYVTCSVFREENDAVIGAGLERHADMQLKNVLPNNNIHDLMCETVYGFQILPTPDGLDGFFFACLTKTPHQ